MNVVKVILWFFISVFLVVLSVSFALENNDLLSVSLWGHNSAPITKWALALTSGLIGMLIAGIFFAFHLISLYSNNVRLRRSLSQLEKAQQLQSSPKLFSGSSEPSLGKEEEV